MASTWHTHDSHDIHIAYAWNTPGIHMVYIWQARGTHTWHTQVIIAYTRIHMTYTRNTHGMRCSWATYGIHMTYIWHTCNAYKWQQHDIHMEYA